MSRYVTLQLKLQDGRSLRFNDDYLNPLKESLASLLEENDYKNSISFAKRMMMGQELKANNMIEGMKDDLSEIDEVIQHRDAFIDSYERKRIINLYHGYQYILTHKRIDKEHLKELYAIISNGILEARDMSRMGTYYRTAPVYILKGNRLDVEPFLGVCEEKIADYMELLFTYINQNSNLSSIEQFIKSQIMHFYFVYIHPYFDVNGRTSRTVSMWYLLNHKCYPYIIFNRAIAFSKRAYETSIVNGRIRGDITLFLKYMLLQVEKELEKEVIIHTISEHANKTLSMEDMQMIEYLLTMNGNWTVIDLCTMYNQYNNKKRPSIIFNERIRPLMEQNIIVCHGYTKGHITEHEFNMHIGLNPAMIDVDLGKIKHLTLK